MDEAGAAPKLSYAELFLCFFQAGLISFGGGLPITRRLVVDDRRWMTAAAFTDLYSLCQLLPGANIPNLAFALGVRYRGLAGGIAAICGLMTAPVIVVLILGDVYTRYGHLPLARHVLAGLAAAAAGLIVASAMDIAIPTFKSIRSVGISVLVFFMVILLHFSLPLTLVIIVPVSLFLSWRSMV